jgi:hypothetical protein
MLQARKRLIRSIMSWKMMANDKPSSSNLSSRQQRTDNNRADSLLPLLRILYNIDSWK